MDNLNLQKIEGYIVQQVADGVWAIDEYGVAIVYLVAGTEKAALIDTGAGLGNLKKVVETLTDLPYFVLNTHGHIDHTGGDSDFEKAYLSEDDWFMVDQKYIASSWSGFLDKTKKEPGFYGAEYMKKDWIPGEFERLPLRDHQIFDFGGRMLEVLCVPGHTPGSVVFLDRANKLLFAGDSVVSTPILIFDKYSTNVTSFWNALKELDKEDFELIFPGHYKRPIGKKVLHDLIHCAEMIINGTAQTEPVDFSHMSVEPAVISRYGSASIAYNEKHI